MNYFLLLVIVGICGGSYYMYTNDQEQIASLQQQVADLKSHGGDGKPAASISTPTLATVAPLTPVAPLTTAAVPVTSVSPAAGAPLPVVSAVQPVTQGNSSAIDAAANAAVAAANGTSIGTVTTLNHKSYTNCKVLKVEKDGVTFSHDDGITKIMYPMMSPELQKQFGYTPDAAVAETEAQIRASQQSAAVTNGAPATP